MPAKFIPLDRGEPISLDKPIMVVGRSPSSDIPIDSRKVSRQHCCIARVNEYLVIRDLGSTNGIRVNGQPCEECRLHDGDEVIIGDVAFRVALHPTMFQPPREPGGAPRGQRLTDSQIERYEIPVPIAESSVEDHRQTPSQGGPIPVDDRPTPHADSNDGSGGPNLSDSGWIIRRPGQ